jgi:hypothetical protein
VAGGCIKSVEAPDAETPIKLAVEQFKVANTDQQRRASWVLEGIVSKRRQPIQIGDLAELDQEQEPNEFSSLTRGDGGLVITTLCGCCFLTKEPAVAPRPAMTQRRPLTHFGCRRLPGRPGLGTESAVTPESA